LILTRIILNCTAFIAITHPAYEWTRHADIAIALLHKEDCHREMIRDAAEAAVLVTFEFNITIYGDSKKEKRKWWRWWQELIQEEKISRQR
jgi:hypothetical protein